MKQIYKTATTVAGSLLLALAYTPVGQGQIVPDATLPNNSVVTPNSNVMTIEGGTTTGGNLFHSFSEFSVPTGGEAFFNNATSIDNILTRVTGGNISNIDGLIRANGGANLFLINPSGIIFGPNARLDIGGSFVGSTAESLWFEDGRVYSAPDPEAPPLLTINVPIGLQMGSNSGEIRVEGPGYLGDNIPEGIEVTANNTLALIGAEVNLEGGNLSAIGGRMELAGVVEGRVGIMPTGGWEYSEVQRFGDIRLSGAALIDAQDGTMQVVGRQIQLRESSLIFSGTRGAVDSGPLTIRASESVEIIGTVDDFFTGLLNDVQPGATGNSGALTIATGQLVIRGGLITNNTRGAGSTGTLRITADTVELRSLQTQFFTLGSIESNVSETAEGGNAGDIIIETNRLSILDGARISSSTFGEGSAGELVIRATELVEMRGVGNEVIFPIPGNPTVTESSRIDSTAGYQIPFSDPMTVKGTAGNITISTAQLLLDDGAYINSATFRNQDGSDVTIRATDSVILRGNNPLAAPFRNTNSSWIASGVQSTRLNQKPQANGGDISITTGNLILVDGAEISAETQGAGEAGNLFLRASESVQLSGTASLLTLVSENAIGNAGEIDLETGTLTLNDGASISSETLGSGNSSNIIIRATEAIALDGSSITNSVGSEAIGNGGELRLQAPQIFLNNSAEIDSSTSGIGNAGEVDILGEVLELMEGATISVSANGIGDAGNLFINASEVNLDERSSLQGTVMAGSQGNLNLNSSLLVLRNNSNITTNAGQQANGGNIAIDTETLALIKNSSISANAFQGAGGNVQITVEGIFVSPDSRITATSELGIDGVVEIINPNVDATSGLVKLPENVVDASNQLSDDCAAARSSSFTVTGRGGLPPNSSEVLRRDRPWVDIRNIGEFRGTVSNSLEVEQVGQNSGAIVEANIWIVQDDGTIELVFDPQVHQAQLQAAMVSCNGSPLNSR